jgi:hypothetical protein
MELIMLSQNGWRVLQAGETHQWLIPDTGRWVRLHPGPAGFVLAHLALWFSEKVERLGVDAWDDWGYAYRPIRGQSSGFSNHASGTALDLNATKHPLGVRGTFTLEQQSRIRGRLERVYRDAIRWGGDYQNRADEMHFEIVVGEPAVLALANRLHNSPRGRRVRDANGRPAG